MTTRESQSTTETPSLLLVEDDEQLQDLYEQFLSDYEIETVATAEAALDLIANGGQYDTMLLDRRLPGMDGGEFLSELSNIGERPPTVLLTAVEPTLNIVDIPFDYYLTKPVKKAELVETVEWLLSGRQFDKTMQELARLNAKRATLQANVPEAELASDDRYQKLLDRLETLSNERDEALSGFETKDFVAAYKRLQTD